MIAMDRQGGATAQTVKHACTPRTGTCDPNRRDTVLNLTDLVDGRIDPAEFFAENYITEGMRTLLTEGFRRLEGKSTQGVFKLTQAMGGGKTHNLLALGLLATYPEHRAEVMGEFYTPAADLGPVRVVAFSGRESDAPLRRLGCHRRPTRQARSSSADYYTPLAAPGQTAWVNLLKGEPLLIMLDELPPYFVNAASKTIGNSDLVRRHHHGASLTYWSLSGRDDLRNVCVVISDLRGDLSWRGKRPDRRRRWTIFEKRSPSRSAMDVEPVRMNTDEFYHILRQAASSNGLPERSRGSSCLGRAGLCPRPIRDAKQMDVTNASPEQVAADRWQGVLPLPPSHPRPLCPVP